MKLTFPKVWFATEQLINSPSRFFNLTDRGSLHFESDTLLFNGRKQYLRIKDIQGIDIISPRIPWVSIVIAIVALLAFLVFFLTRMHFEFIFIVLGLAIVLPSLSILIPFLVLTQKVILWIEIAFIDDRNGLQRAYFLDASRLFGWGSRLDNTLKMYRELRTIPSSKAG